MLNGVDEEHQVHSLGTEHHVEVLQRILGNLLDLDTIGQLAIHILVWLLGWVVVGVNQRSEGSEQEWLDLDDLFPILLELDLHQVDHKSTEVIPVLYVDETVLEHSQALVAPQLDEGLLVLATTSVSLGKTLEHLGQVSQVEGVVRLGGRGTELFLHIVVHVDSR
jgi:hypothetical protein